MGFSHLTPIGVEKIAIKLAATRNVANVDEFEASLGNMGSRPMSGIAGASGSSATTE